MMTPYQTGDESWFQLQDFAVGPTPSKPSRAAPPSPPQRESGAVLPGDRFSAAALPRHPARFYYFLERLNLDPQRSGIAWEYAEPFFKAIQKLDQAVRFYPLADAFPAANRSLQEIPTYAEFLRERIRDIDINMTSAQRRYCAQDLMALAEPEDLNLLDMLVTRMRGICIAAPHEPEAQSNPARLSMLFVCLTQCFEAIKGRAAWEAENGEALLRDMHNELSASLRALKPANLDG